MDKKYIELEAAVQALNSEGITKNMRAHRKVLAIPAADVAEVRHGEWKFKEYGEDTYTNLTRIYECSLCGRTIECLNEADEPYCHCGAKMDGKGDAK